MARNTELEFERNRERYAFLRFGQQAFDGLTVVPPATGIVHQVNLEFLARVVQERGTAQALPGHAARHRLAHDDGQRPRRARLGRRRHRGRGGHARRGGLDARPAGGRLPADGQAAGRLHGHRPRADGDADPPRDRRGREVRRVLRRRTRRIAGRRPRDARKHVARVRRNVRLLPRRRRDARATCGSPDARRSTSRWSRPTARRTCSGTTRPTASPTYSQIVELDLSTVEPSLAGPRRPQDRVPLRDAKESFLAALPSFGIDYGTADDAASAESFPASDPVAAGAPGHEESQATATVAVPDAGERLARGLVRAGRRALSPRPRRRRHRRHHELHEHLEPAGDGRRGTARQEGRRARPCSAGRG